MEFKNLGLAEPIVRAVARAGYTHPTPIQSQAIPIVLAGRDVLGCAQTGTGKTAAFALPIIHRLSETSKRRNVETEGPEAERRKPTAKSQRPKAKSQSPRALILAPTRELAAQIGDSFRAYGKGLRLTHLAIFGGVNQNPQVRAMRSGVDILIATPGRLMDLVNQRHIDLRAIEILVLDEADRMLDMGFMPDIRRITAILPKKRQTLLFSATMPREIRALADSILNDPANVQVDPVGSTVRTIAQSVYHVPMQSKPALLHALLRGEAAGRTLVFTRTKHGADKVVKGLLKSGLRAEAIHGNKSQNARTRALTAFKSSVPPVLVATDIASRGIDVDDIAHVINYDMPIDPETYVHRIGRTARAGASGAAVSFCSREERSKLRAIERTTGVTIAVRNDQPEHTTDATAFNATEKATSREGRSFRADRVNGGGARRSRSKAKSRRNDTRDFERPSPKRKSKSRTRTTPRTASSSSSSTAAPKKPHAGYRQRFQDGEIISASSNGRGFKKVRSANKSARPANRQSQSRGKR